MNRTISVPFSKNFSAYLSAPDDKAKHPGLIVIHEVWGLKDHIKDVADRFAKEGYVALAPDLLSETGITEKIDQSILKEIMNPATRDEAQKKMRAAMTPIMQPEFGKNTIEKLKACIDYLLNNNQVNGQVAVVGFCFGGTFAYALAAADNRLQAVVPFYGQSLNPLERVQTISCPIQAFYGEKDQNLISQLPELENKMKEYGKDFQYKVYPNTGHAFFNDTNPVTYNKKAAQDAWAATLAFLEQSLEH
jgi:carboxymethylenebutenolidase